jgi:hypothetical protein
MLARGYARVGGGDTDMGKRGPKPRYRVPSSVVLDELDVLPPFRRGAPPGRKPDSYPLITEAMGLGAEWFPNNMIRPIRMPRGGDRWLVRCPACERWVLRLYSPDSYGPTYDGNQWRCRHCWHLHYPSEYSGRRPTASRERMAALVESIRKARTPAARERREERLEDAIADLNRRELAWLRRFIANEPDWMRG